MAHNNEASRLAQGPCMEMGEGIDRSNGSLKSWLCLPSHLISGRPLFCLHTYWIVDGNAHKYCLLWVNIRLAIGWGGRRVSLSNGQVRSGWRGATRVGTAKPGRALGPSLQRPCPLVLTVRFPAVKAVGVVIPVAGRKRWMVTMQCPCSTVGCAFFFFNETLILFIFFLHSFLK